MKFAKILAVVCFMGLVAAGSAHAGLLDMFTKKPVITAADVYPIQNDVDFDDEAKSYHRTPFGDPELEYEIKLPKDWVSVETPPARDAGAPSLQLMGDLDRFKSPVIYTMQATVTVQVIKLDHEISAENWLRNYILDNKCSLKNDVVATNNKKAGAECISTTPDGVSDYSYMTVQINGNNAVLVKFESPLSLEPALRYVRKKIVDGFRFVLETDRPIEAQKSFNFADALKFRYPESLQLRNVDDKDTRHMSIQLYNLKKAQGLDPELLKNVSLYEGLIDFVVVKRSDSTSLKKETDDIRHFVEEGGGRGLDMKINKLVSSSDKFPVEKRFLFSRYEVYEVSTKKGNAIEQELRFVALGDQKWYVFALLLTPAQNEDPHVWAVNLQDFNMIVKDFR